MGLRWTQLGATILPMAEDARGAFYFPTVPFVNHTMWIRQRGAEVSSALSIMSSEVDIRGAVLG